MRADGGWRGARSLHEGERGGGGFARGVGRDKRSAPDGMGGSGARMAPLRPHFPTPARPTHRTHHARTRAGQYQEMRRRRRASIGRRRYLSLSGRGLAAANELDNSSTDHPPSPGPERLYHPSHPLSLLLPSPSHLPCSTTTRCPTTSGHRLSAVVVSSPTEAACSFAPLSPTPCHRVRRAQDSLTSPATASSSPTTLDDDNNPPHRHCLLRRRLWTSENIPFASPR